jgi:hypothetical protein
MKRGFLFGLGWFLGLLPFVMLYNNFQASLEDRHVYVAEIILAILIVPIAVFVLFAARRAPPNRSRLSAVVGWLLGFFILDAVGFVVVAAVYLSGH